MNNSVPMIVANFRVVSVSVIHGTRRIDVSMDDYPRILFHRQILENLLKYGSDIALIVVICSSKMDFGISATCVIPRDLPPWCEDLRNVFNDFIIEMDDPLLLPFSSGTGGKQRCVILTHKNYSSATAILKRALFDELVVNTRRRTVAVLPFYHASGFWALLYCLLEGCHTIIMKSFHPISMLEIIEKYEIDTLNVVPSILSFLCRMDIYRFNVSSLSTVLCGSSPLGKELINLFLRKFPNVQNLVQGYGMTEVVVLSHITPLGIVDEKRFGTCGKLLPGFEAILRDDNGRLINEPYCAGELYIKSPTVMRGYLNLETDEEPFDQDGWFKTGDVLYYDDEGFFFVVDRVKDLIKVNGVQVAPSEIEDIILTLPFVKEVGVIGVNDPEHGQVPKAFIVLEEEEDEEYAKKNILALVKAKLSPIKQLRGGIEVRMELPKTNSGKVKRYALRNLYE
ncbi:hypothetical protein KIN20_023037 [Parelaphostrongylus tenuis]|uniref:Luciferin 4-monooxygenase n=1 Tax=Parelaphostrongylus tenuis TaxID=148309 RepID=A0AAD5MUZ5_PARTN|nr:hypothetical protein KIN20_023037 [Parelaphostrongylus tenuis]